MALCYSCGLVEPVPSLRLCERCWRHGESILRMSQWGQGILENRADRVAQVKDHILRHSGGRLDGSREGMVAVGIKPTTKR